MINEEDGCMRYVRHVHGVRLKDGRERFEGGGHWFVMYDDGVQMENDNGATLYDWSEIAEVLV